MGRPGQRKIPDSLFRIWEEERRKPLRIGTRNLRSVLPELWAGQVKLHSKSLNNSTGRLLNTHYSSINRSRKDDKPPSQLRSRKQARAKNTVWRRNEQRKWRERMKEEEGIKPRKIKTEKGEEGRGTRRAGLDPIGRFLGGQEGRGGYISGK